MLSNKVTRSIAAAGAAVMVAIGAYTFTGSGSTPPPTATSAPAVQSVAASAGQAPQSWRPGTGTIITGAAADKATAAAVAAYPGGTVNRVLQLSDGSYAVHRIGTSSPHHIFVNTAFKVTGTA